MAQQDKYLQRAMAAKRAERQKATEDARRHKEELREKVSGYTEAEKQYIEAALELAKTGAGEENLRLLEQQQRQLLESHGYTADYAQIQYCCPICKDTGTAEGKLCVCVRQKVNRYRRAEAEGTAPLSVCRFDNFFVELYPAQRDNATGLVPRQHMTEILQGAKEYAAHFYPGIGGLLFVGKAGLGKTHLALAIADAVLQQGYDVAYASAQSAFSKIEADHFQRNDDSFLTNLLEADLLVLDDLGTEFVNAYTLSVLYQLINSRMLKGKSSIYTTNLNAERDFVPRYTEKIASRLLGSTSLFHFFGEDIRLQLNP